MDHFKKLLELCKLERGEDKRAYEAQAKATTVVQRRQAGLIWYPIAIKGTELNRADYLSIEVERTTHQDVNHQFRFGASVALFSNHDAQNDRLEGTLTYAGGNKARISFKTEELPEWADNGKLGIELLFDDNTYDEMEAALKLALTVAEKREEGRLVQVLTGNTKPEFAATLKPCAITQLNELQRAAVDKILAARDVAIVHGPPGTGKTTTLVQAILQMIANGGQQVLVVAPSNTAVDLLAEKLSETGLNVLRVGNPARVTEKLLNLTLDNKIAAHTDAREIKRLKKQAGEFKDMAHKYKRQFGRAEREQRKALFQEARRIMTDVERLEQYITGNIIGSAQVVAATPVGANHYTIRHLKYDTVVIDEAGQALEPACWIPILKGKKVVLSGDHQQLPPTLKAEAAIKGGLGVTLLERCIALYPEAVVMLQEQYRMHETIMGYSSRVFYQDKLTAHYTVAGHQLFEADTPLQFIDTAGCGYEEKVEDSAISNPEEAAFVLRHLERLAEELSTHCKPEMFPSIGIIAPYRHQATVLKELLDHSTILQPYKANIAINTVDSFQGQERDIIYISLTRCNSDGIIGFLGDTRRMNVAMTRARKKLVVTGDSATLGRHKFYADFIAYAEAHNAWFSAWEFME